MPSNTSFLGNPWQPIFSQPIFSQPNPLFPLPCTGTKRYLREIPIDFGGDFDEKNITSEFSERNQYFLLILNISVALKIPGLLNALLSQTTKQFSERHETLVQSPLLNRERKNFLKASWLLHQKDFGGGKYQMNGVMRRYVIMRFLHGNKNHSSQIPISDEIRKDESHQFEIITSLMDHGADPNPVFCHSNSLSLTLVQALHQKRKMDINTMLCGERGISAFHCKMLICNDKARDATITYFIQNKVNINHNLQWKRYPIGTPLHQLLRYIHLKPSYLDSFLSAMRLAIQCLGVDAIDLKQRDGEGNTLLILASQLFAVEAVKEIHALAKMQSEINAQEYLDQQDKERRTAVYHAIEIGDYETAVYLISQGASLQVQASDGENLVNLLRKDPRKALIAHRFHPDRGAKAKSNIILGPEGERFFFGQSEERILATYENYNLLVNFYEKTRPDKERALFFTSMRDSLEDNKTLETKAMEGKKQIVQYLLVECSEPKLDVSGPLALQLR